MEFMNQKVGKRMILTWVIFFKLINYIRYRFLFSGILCLRIGGPRLLHAFASQNKLPSTSYICKVLNTTIRIDYSYKKCFSQIMRSNILRFFNICKGFYSIKLDEMAIVQKARWSSDNNEIIGFCYNHKDCIKSFSFETH